MITVSVEKAAASFVVTASSTTGVEDFNWFVFTDAGTLTEIRTAVGSPQLFPLTYENFYIHVSQGEERAGAVLTEAAPTTPLVAMSVPHIILYNEGGAEDPDDPVDPTLPPYSVTAYLAVKSDEWAMDLIRNGWTSEQRHFHNIWRTM